MTREEFIIAVKAEQESLRRFLLVLCEGDRVLADDIAQDALVKAYMSMDNFQGKSKFSTWVFRIAYNCFIDEKRKINSRGGGRGEDLSSPAAQRLSSQSDDPSAAFRYQALYKAIEGLKDNERSAILLFYMEDLPTKEIAKILGAEDGTIRAWLSRGREHLKNKLQYEYR